MDNTSNRDRLYLLRAKVIRSVYWGGKLMHFYEGGMQRYGPMLKDDVFNRIFDGSDVAGALEMETKLGRSIKIEELAVAPLSVEYLTLGNVIITGSEEESRTLDGFEQLIDEGLRKQEGRAITKRIRDLKILRDTRNR